MKLSTIIIALVLCLTSVTFAYDYTIEDGWTAGLTLQNSESLLMTGGGMDDLTLYDHTSATIQGTSPLGEFIGGVWHISLAYYSHLDLSGGEVNYLGMNNYATATLSGGSILQIHNYQVVASNPHIEIICRDHSWNAPANILTGTWQDYTTFNIHLCNHAPYDPTIENIKFTIVPEPFSLLLLSAGGTLLARRCR
jgi:hypothetical protein